MECLSKAHSTTVVLNWRGVPSRGESMNFLEGTSPYTSYNIVCLIIEFTSKYLCFYSLFKVRELETKDNYLTL